jgi:exopolyphosphatase/guanosine-5'-triphosphate,3'-diphosphate pyrophosphatase
LPEPISIAAIDAGSNAIRMVIARAESSDDIQVLETERWPVRLGHRAFTEGRLERATLDHAVQAFRHFRSRLRRYGVRDCRAVATAAAREARNRHALVRRIFRETGIRLEVIDSAEEARLVRAAVLGQLGEKLAPRLIIDLGGGSLEISLLRGKAVLQTVALPLGTVRLMETFGIAGQLNEEELERLRHHVLSMLKTTWRDQADFSVRSRWPAGGTPKRWCGSPPARA